MSFGRFKYLEKAIKCFNQQDLKHKELVVFTNEVEKVRAFVNLSDNIIVPGVDPRLTVGQMKNLGCEIATGDFICNWEDNVISHPKRLSTQLQFLIDRKLDATLYSDCLRYFPHYRYLYWINLGNDYKYKDRSFVQSSILFKSSLFLEKRKIYFEEEDRDVDSFLVKELINHGKLVKGMYGLGYQYLMICDGSKVPKFERKHWWTDLKISEPMPEEMMFRRKNEIDMMLAPFQDVEVKISGKKIWEKGLQRR